MDRSVDSSDVRRSALLTIRRRRKWWSRFIVIPLSLISPWLVSSGVALAQGSSLETSKISPTLYFPDAASELRSRQQVHAALAPLEKELEGVPAGSLVAELERAWQLMSDLQRHAAYLKVQGLEDTKNQTVKQARESVNADQSVLEAAIDKRLREVPKREIPFLGRYSLLASEVQSDAGHTLSPEAELYRSSTTAPHEEALADSYDNLISSIGVFKEVTSLDAPRRRSAFAERNARFDASAPAAACLLAALLDIENRDAMAHAFANAADRKYQSLGLKPEDVDKLLATVATEASVYRDYQTVIAEHASKKLGVNPILADELKLAVSAQPPIPFAQAKGLILDALAPLGADYTSRFSNLLDPASGRLDLSGGANRAHAGTSIAVFDAPVALYFTGYDGSMDSLDTIVHEGGHAIHRELMNTSGIPIYQREGAHYLFEGFAIFNELLLLDHMEQIAKTTGEKERALEAFLQEIAFELFTSAEETTFERSLYTAASGKSLLDRAQVDGLYRTAIAPYESWPLSQVATSRAWMRKSLLFEDPLYLVNYLYAALVAVALYEKEQTDPHFVDSYETLLRRGFDAEPSALLASIGIKLDDPHLLQSIAELFREKTTKLQALYSEE